MDYITEHPLEEYYDIAFSGATNPVLSKRDLSSISTDDKWTGTKSLQEACQLATLGWQDGREFMGQILTEIQSNTFEETRTKRYDVTGQYDISRVISGEADCAIVRPRRKTQQIVRIAFGFSVSAGITTQVIRWKGATVLALIDMLEAQNIRVELDLIESCRQGEQKWITLIHAKQANEAVDIDKLAFPLVHPSMLRRVQFAYQENTHHIPIREFGIGSSYGSPIQNTKEALTGLIDYEYDLYVPAIHLDSADKAVEEIQKLFNQVTQPKELTY